MANTRAATSSRNGRKIRRGRHKKSMTLATAWRKARANKLSGKSAQS